jgi:hypothetical protein
MIRSIAILPMAALAVMPLNIFAKTGLQGTAGHQSIYFSDELKLRHHRYFLDLKQNTELLPYKLSTVLDGRIMTDAAVSTHDFAPKWDFADPVRDDEALDTILRQGYIDYITDSTETKIGIQQIDWVESMAQNVSNILTPIDMRFGGFGASNELIQPVGAINFNHKFLFGSVDWLLITHPKTNRFPKGPNGYGYYETLSALVGGASFTVEAEADRELTLKNSETGIRYSMNFDAFNLTLIGFRGMNRSPILRAVATSPASFMIRETHPVVNTFVISGSTSSSESLVFRALALHQPNRPIGYSIGTPATANQPPEASQKHTRLVIGLDYAFSKHLKFYSESIASQSETDPADFYEKNQRSEPRKNEYASSFRLTNESLDDTVFSLETTLTGPDRSSAVTAQAEWTFAGAYRLNVGGRRFVAKDQDSSFYPLRKANQYFLALERSFNEKSFE